MSETTAPVPPAPHDVAAAAPVKTPELTSKRTKPKRTGQGTPPTHHGKASSSHSGPSAVGKASHVAVSASKAKPFLQDYKDPKKSENDLPMGKVLLDLVLKLIVVLGIAWVAIYVLSKFKGSGGPLPGRKGHMKVLESVNLGPNRSVHLVRVGEKVLVVGSTPEQVNTLGEVDDPALRDELMQDRSPFSFNAHLNDALKRGDEPPKRGDAPHDLAGNVQGGAKHIWGRVQEIRGLGGGKGGSG